MGIRNMFPMSSGIMLSGGYLQGLGIKRSCRWRCRRREIRADGLTGAGTDTRGGCHGAPALCRGVRISAGILTVERYRNFQAVPAVRPGSGAGGDLRTEAMCRHRGISSFLTGERVFIMQGLLWM